ncbi:YggS family pyridoxal phosphate-dependent enzyme [Chitinasiproducens palmae]|uniref:Pyridoxal phosphate homeostasis protein n=1 Tax=Chitinasiproducens palmae TaxID=1770053 RepID=A0A1H2PTB6_9BURK|nr:YggS family pyridoxal phosphate-dependent enzyme [Chitinasiproducens palmae]SDV49477.1 hypothetical protein SAMN05216551_108117 [Chitinasiproducens palmae]
MPVIAARLAAVTQRIRLAEQASQREPGSVSLLAVSKTFPHDAVREAFAAGQRAFGENYVQEALDKMAALSDLDEQIVWHFIGPLQSNKSRPVAERFAWVHSVDRVRLAQRLSEQRPAHLPPLNVCVQVNISGESSKSGAAPDELPALVRAVAALPNLRLRGLMAIPAPSVEAAEQRAAHQRLRALFDTLNETGLGMDTVSAGMSDDLEAAVAEGATLVRIGTAIFGQRNYSA